MDTSIPGERRLTSLIDRIQPVDSADVMRLLEAFSARPEGRLAGDDLCLHAARICAMHRHEPPRMNRRLVLLCAAGCEEDGEAASPVEVADAAPDEPLEGDAVALEEADADFDEEPSEADAADATVEAEPDAAPPGDTWDTWAAEFFATYCTGCHSGGTRDYRTIDVGPEPGEGCGAWPPPRQFPVGNGPKPEDDERARLVAWIEAGLAE